MTWKTEWKKLFLVVAVFLGCFYLPIESARFNNALTESLQLVKSYARGHVLLCLVPAFFIAFYIILAPLYAVHSLLTHLA